MFNWYFQWSKRTSTRQSAELGVPHFSARSQEVNLRGLDAGLIPVQSRCGLAEAHVCSLVTLLCVLVWGNQRRLWAPFIIPIITFLVCSQSTQKVLCVALLIRSLGLHAGLFTCPHAQLSKVSVRLKNKVLWILLQEVTK